jgi:hypothetical protein
MVLSTFVADNLMTPFYRSRDKDFRQIGVTVGSSTYSGVIDQNLESFA